MTSNAETLLAVQLEQAGIPFEREFRFAPPRRWRADFVTGWPNKDKNAKNMGLRPFVAMILIEIDGGGYVAGRHSRGPGMEADCEKQSAAAILGYRVIRCTPRQVENGTALSWIRQALGLEHDPDCQLIDKAHGGPHHVRPGHPKVGA
jgi:hypothetical protein